MMITGKGFYIWKVNQVEGGNPQKILDVAQKANLSHVLIKIADGERSYNYDSTNRVDLVAPVAKTLMDAGIQVWGWQYIYGENPVNEARKAIQRMGELNLDGFVVNAESEFKQPGKDVAATTYMQELRNGLPDHPIALSSYRFPSYHTKFPWDQFLTYSDINMPQVYWVGSHNPAEQLERSVREFEIRTVVRPLVVTGSAYTWETWSPTPAEMQEFMNAARTLNINAVNFWSWDFARANLPNIWQAVADYPWPIVPAEKDLPEKYIDALNANDAIKIAMLYIDSGALIHANRAIQGQQEILKWYYTFLNSSFKNARFELTGVSGTGNSRHFTWVGLSGTGSRIIDGNSTVGLRDGKIQYHYKHFHIDGANALK